MTQQRLKTSEMTESREPRANSAGGKALAALRDHRKPLHRVVMSNVLEVPEDEVDDMIAYPIKEGFIKREMRADGVWYSVGNGVPLQVKEPPLNGRPKISETPTIGAHLQHVLDAPVGVGAVWAAPVDAVPGPVISRAGIPPRDRMPISVAHVKPVTRTPQPKAEVHEGAAELEAPQAQGGQDDSKPVATSNEFRHVPVVLKRRLQRREPHRTEDGAAPAAEPETKAHFRVGLFSDGECVIEDGAAVHRFTREKSYLLAKFFQLLDGQLQP